MKSFSLPGLILLPSLLFALLLSGCGSRQQAQTVPGRLPELMERIYGNAPAADWPQRETYPILPENMAYFLGTDHLPIQEGLASEARSPALPHSVCLLRLSDAAAAAEVCDALSRHADPYKWLVAGVEPEGFIVDSIGDLVILILSEDARTLHRGFLALDPARD